MSVLQYKPRRILVPNYNLWIFYISCLCELCTAIYWTWNTVHKDGNN